MNQTLSTEQVKEMQKMLSMQILIQEKEREAFESRRFNENEESMEERLRHYYQSLKEEGKRLVVSPEEEKFLVETLGQTVLPMDSQNYDDYDRIIT